jgi:ABC-2 type transport system permease protein
MGAIYKREMLAYFTCPTGYVFAAIYFAISGAVFSITTFGVQSTATGTYFTFMLISFIILIPLLTMKLLSEERRSKTEQILLTSPVSLMEVIFAKFFAAYTLFTGTLVISSVVNTYALARIASEQKDVISKLNLPTVIGSIVGILLIGGVFISIGLFLSALTEMQIVAAISSIGVFIFIFLLSIVPSFFENSIIRTVIKWISIFDRYYAFTGGVFDITAVIYYISLTVVFLFLTIRVYEKRRWS